MSLEIVDRVWVALLCEHYAEVLAGECAHSHRIIKDKHDTLRWEKFPERKAEIMKHFGAIDLNGLFRNGANRNDPLVRQLYRCMGYSISGYWEVFYWEMNNDEADDWNSSLDTAPDLYA